MPVSSLSRCICKDSPCRNRAIRRSSSTWHLRRILSHRLYWQATAGRCWFPFDAVADGTVMSSCPPIWFRLALSASIQASLIGSIACRPLSERLPMREKHVPRLLWDNAFQVAYQVQLFLQSPLNSGFRKKYSTTSSRPLMGFTSFRGIPSNASAGGPHRLIVLSITSNKLLPPSFMLPISSRLRTVNLSRRTYLSSSIRASEVICPICVCCVIMRYCKIAPEAMILFLRCSTPNPFRFFTSKCFSSFSRAVVP